MTTIATARLILRPHVPADAGGLVRYLGNFSVSRWTARVPYPYALADADTFLRLPDEGAVRRAIALKETPSELIGGIGYEWKADALPEIGYWLAEGFWRRGYAAEAARAMVDHAFDVTGHQSMVASYQIGNEASRRILEGLGFAEVGQGTSFSLAQNADTRIMWLRLDGQGRRP